jgi:uncharacterized protein YrrD
MRGPAMLKCKDVVGKKVLSRSDGEKVGSVKDLIIGKDHAAIMALVIEEGGLFSKAKVVPMEKVASIGRDAVIISDSDDVLLADTFAAAKEIMDRDDQLIGKKVFTEKGDEFSAVSDICFDEDSGQILGFEVSGGRVDNVSVGPSYLPMSEIVTIGPDAVLVKADAVSRLVTQANAAGGTVQGPASARLETT